ncbi:hypothetical protein LTR84_011571 [Exophiala bonariae]|uniref:Uncharacterized protein n=1 Tax=Exophiala bonariae TaxID=1690606 RepID=A0AAV9NK23_9EURO|nr:hypothetical protein LTR84_011571 [Exophiala bonariae]
MKPVPIAESMQKLRGVMQNYLEYKAKMAAAQPVTHSMEEAEPQFISRKVNDEVDTVAISPLHPEYMVIGTYHLLSVGEPREYDAQMRRGTIQVMLVSPKWAPRYSGMLPPTLDKLVFKCAILDIRFHPTDPSIFAAATSTGYMHFFRFVKQGDVLGRRVVTKLLPLGVVKVADPDEHGLEPSITQFNWIPDISNHGIQGIDDFHRLSLVYCTSFGDTSVVTADVPAIHDIFDHRLAKPVANLEPTNYHVHKHKRNLEAWTVASAVLRTTRESTYRIIFSGGDDEALIATSIDLGNTTSPSYIFDEFPTMKVDSWRDSRSHESGVVAVLPLAKMHQPLDDGNHGIKLIMPFLTGSYDEQLRIFEMDVLTKRAVLVKTSPKFAGAVWRLKIMDEYNTLTTEDGEIKLLENEEEHTNLRTKHFGGKLEHHILLLVSLSHAGAMILRVTAVRGTVASECKWSMTELVRFRGDHESMVYCCDARLEPPPSLYPKFSYKAVRKTSRPHKDEPALGPTYTIVSASFYDCKICTWTFVDRLKGCAQLKPIERGEKSDRAAKPGFNRIPY